jgi:hypothetical protein
MSSPNDRLPMRKGPDEKPATDAGAGRNTDRFPPFNDPAFSADKPEPVVKPDAAPTDTLPKDTQYEGHPDFSQEAAKNRTPRSDPSTSS